MPRKKTVISEDYNKPFPERLRTIMTQQEKTQQEVAQALGKTRQAVSYYMDGSSSPDWETLSKLAQYFGVSADWLVGLSEVKSQDADVQMVCQYTGLSEEAIAVLHKISSPTNFSCIISAMLTCNNFEWMLLNIIDIMRYKDNITPAMFAVKDELTSNNSKSNGDSWNVYWSKLLVGDLPPTHEFYAAVRDVRCSRFDAIDNFTQFVDELTNNSDFDDEVISFKNQMIAARDNFFKDREGQRIPSNEKEV
jgi:transcriptional regulator with XRE-family HTH domain